MHIVRWVMLTVVVVRYSGKERLLGMHRYTVIIALMH